MPDLEKILDHFCANPVPDRVAFAPLFTTSGAAIAAKDDKFADGLAQLTARLNTATVDRVLLLSFIWRLTSVTSMREHRNSLVRTLAHGIPELEELPSTMPDPDDRRHFADALSYVSNDWLPQYIARSIVAERDGEKARAGLSRAFILAVPEFDQQLRLITDAISNSEFDQADPTIGRARRVAAIFAALSEAAWSANEATPGQDFGSALSQLIEIALLRPPVKDWTIATSTAHSVLIYLITVVRLHGPMAADAKTYTVLAPLRRLFGKSGWPDGLSEPLNRAARQVLEQLVFLVQLGKPDNILRNTIISMWGEVVSRRQFEKAANNAEIDVDAAHWLRTGSARRVFATQNAVTDLALSSIDSELGAALRDADAIDAAMNTLNDELMSIVEYERSQLKVELAAFFRRTTALVKNVKLASRRRGLVLKGSVGETVEFSPLEHVAEGTVIGARTVRIRNRAVERIVDGRSMGVVLKADVDSWSE